MYGVNATLFFILVFLVATMTYIWKNRWFYYYILQFPGSLSGIIYVCKLFLTTRKNLLERLFQFCKLQPPIFKIWAPNYLFIVNSEPEDLEILLGIFLDKSSFYNIPKEFMGQNISNLPGFKDFMTALILVVTWKERRREYNKTFNTKIITSFHGNFVKYAKKIVENLDQICSEDQTDLLPVIWRCIIDNSLENLGDIDPVLIENRYIAFEYITDGIRILMERIRKFWFIFDFFFRFSRFQKEVRKMMEQSGTLREAVFTIKMKEMKIIGSTASDLKRKRFSNHMFNLYTSDKLTKTEVVDEIDFMLIAAAETTSQALIFAILILGIHKEVQEKIYQEISSVSKTSDEDVSVEDIDHMDYLERVVKEILRLFPTLPIIMRSIDKNFKLGSFTYPAGSHLVVPIYYIHRRSDLWPDPLKFDPDRFLPEEVAKRPRCAYIPFSFGSRNCIGLKYGLLSLKVNLAYIVKNFKIETINCQKLEYLKVDWLIITEPAEYSVVFERRASAK